MDFNDKEMSKNWIEAPHLQQIKISLHEFI